MAWKRRISLVLCRGVPVFLNRRIRATLLAVVIVVSFGVFFLIDIQGKTRNCLHVETTAEKEFSSLYNEHEVHLHVQDIRTKTVDNLTKTLQQMLKIDTNLSRPYFNRPCTNIWLPCQPRVCTRNISNNLEERVWDILSPKFRLTEQQRTNITLFSQSLPSNDILFLSAASSNHFNEAQAMIENLHTFVFPRVFNMTFIFLDLGLTSKQRNLTEKACRCHVVSFPFHLFPNWFKNLLFFHWKPIFILAAMMKANSLVVYQDSSINWKDTVIELLQRASKLSLQFYVPKMFHNIPTATVKGMFDYMGEEPCTYLPFSQTPANFAIFKRTQLVTRLILEPWAKCAYEKECLTPNTVTEDRNCSKPHTSLHSCHRFDQSAFSIIVTKLFAKDEYKYCIPDTERENSGKYITVDRARKNPNYFKNELKQ